MTKKDFIKILKLERKELIDFGFKQWNEPNEGVVLMLIPGKYYNLIPLGYPIVSISGAMEVFSKDSDNDTRYGVLPYGIVVKYKNEI